MKKLTFAALCVMASLLASCAIFVYDDEPDESWNDDPDTTRITIIHSLTGPGQ